MNVRLLADFNSSAGVSGRRVVVLACAI